MQIMKGKTAKQIQEEKHSADVQNQKEAILLRLGEIDLEKVRPLCAITLKTDTKEDMEKLKSLEKEASDLRKQLRELAK